MLKKPGDKLRDSAAVAPSGKKVERRWPNMCQRTRRQARYHWSQHHAVSINTTSAASRILPVLTDISLDIPAGDFLALLRARRALAELNLLSALIAGIDR